MSASIAPSAHASARASVVVRFPAPSRRQRLRAFVHRRYMAWLTRVTYEQLSEHVCQDIGIAPRRSAPFLSVEPALHR